MLRSSIPCVARTFGSVLVVLLLVGCGGNPDEPPNPYHLTTDIKGDPSIERTRVEREVEEVAALSSGEEYTLYMPNALEIGSDGRVYVFDYGNNQIKAFTRDGEYLRTYGKGEGRGPGQMITMLDVGVWQDSLVYVVDGRQRRVLYFRHDTGVFIRHESYESGISRFARTGDSTTYAGVVGPERPDFLRMTTRDGQQKMVSRPLSEEVSGLTLDGILQATEDRALYVFRYFPVILTYAPEDTTGVATPRRTMGPCRCPKHR